MDRTDFQQALVAIQMEYLDMPRLKLTLGQLARLGTLQIDVCKAAVEALVATGFLIEAADRSYLRRGTPPVHVEHLDALTWAMTPGVGAAAP